MDGLMPFEVGKETQMARVPLVFVAKRLDGSFDVTIQPIKGYELLDLRVTEKGTLRFMISPTSPAARDDRSPSA